ncbi:MAG: hypothetical protein E7035_00725 [Verrucomicrobiaceae bacterium]|jgi:hypothetical protein|nr:hypothetical protein [Verrucomicrobiaceae bacterium]
MLDKIRSAALEGYVKNKFSSYFENKDFSADLNTTDCYLNISCTLAGEDSQTIINIEKFELVKTDDGKDLIVRKITSNKLWIQRLAEDYLLNKPVSLPSFIAGAL